MAGCRPTSFIPLAEQSELILELGAFALSEAVGGGEPWAVLGDVADVALRHGQPLGPPVPRSRARRRRSKPRSRAAGSRRTVSSSRSPRASLLLNVDRDDERDRAPIAALGVGFALDDFGTGYSSLSYLALLSPHDHQDRPVLRQPGSENEQQRSTLLEAIISLGHKLGMTCSPKASRPATVPAPAPTRLRVRSGLPLLRGGTRGRRGGHPRAGRERLGVLGPNGVDHGRQPAREHRSRGARVHVGRRRDS